MSIYQALVIYQGHPHLDNVHLTRISVELDEELYRQVKKHCPRTQDADRESVANHAMACVLRAFKQRKLPTDDDGFRRYLYVVMRNGITDGLRDLLQPENEGKVDVENVMARVSSPTAGSARLMEALIERVAALCVQWTRFPEVPEQTLQYIVRGLMDSKPAGPRMLQLVLAPHFGQRNHCAWFQDYVLVLIRRALYQLKGEEIEL